MLHLVPLTNDREKDKDKQKLVFVESTDDNIEVNFWVSSWEIVCENRDFYLYNLDCGDQGYDTYSGAVISAPSAQHALAIARSFLHGYGYGTDWENSEITFLGVSHIKKCALILASFHAG